LFVIQSDGAFVRDLDTDPRDTVARSVASRETSGWSPTRAPRAWGTLGPNDEAGAEQRGELARNDHHDTL